MGIFFPKPPHHVACAGIPEFLGRPQSRAFLPGVDVQRVRPTEPFPVYYATLDDLEADRLPLQPRSWRSLIVRDQQAVAEVELDAETGAIVALQRGPRAAATHRAFGLLQSLGENYELRMLESPPVQLVAIWLHAVDDEVILPVEPDLTGLQRDARVRLREARPRLRELAAFVRRAQTDNAGPSGG